MMNEYDLRDFWGLTWAGWLNCLVLQWFGFRLWRHIDNTDTIEKWSVIWDPIWQSGWSLPRRGARLPPEDLDVAHDIVDAHLTIARTRILQCSTIVDSVTILPRPKRTWWQWFIYRRAPQPVLILNGYALSCRGTMRVSSDGLLTT